MKRNESNLYFIQEYLQTAEVQHGGVGNKDIERVLLKSQFQPILWPDHFSFSLNSKVRRTLAVIKTIFNLPSNSTVVFQWPLYATLNKFFTSCILRFRKDIKTICILTDINGLKDADEKLLTSEIKFFKRIQFFVVHNESMRSWLSKHNVLARMCLLEFFDFLIPDWSNKQISKTDSIVFAGFLDKSLFVLDLDKIDDMEFHLYGLSSFSFLNKANLHYHGVSSNEKLLKEMKGSFGLVWDGDSIEGLRGVYGVYNNLISPHKLSLYVMAGLPVIAHHSSGSASIIRKYQIGFTVDSLYEIKEQINRLSEGDYQLMRKNCASVAYQIRSGCCLLRALSGLCR